MVEWLQLASLSLEDLHTYKKLREARCGYGPVQCNGPLQELRVNKRDGGVGQKGCNKSFESEINSLKIDKKAANPVTTDRDWASIFASEQPMDIF